MRTYLDSFANQLFKGVHELPRALRRKWQRLSIESPTEFLIGMIDLMVSYADAFPTEYCSRAMLRSLHGEQMEGVSEASFSVLAPALMAYVNPDLIQSAEIGIEGIFAVKPPSELIDELRSATASGEDMAKAMDDLRRNIACFEFGTYLPALGGGHILRAAFTRPNPNGADNVLLSCVITRGEKASAIVHWTVNVAEGDVILGEPFGYSPVEFDWRSIGKEASALVLRLTRYRQEVEPSRRTHLPRTSLRDFASYPKSRAKRLKKFSLFRVETFAHGYRMDWDRPIAPPSQGRKLAWRAEVKGHYREQPYGPKRSLRRRIWVEAHERAKDKPKRVTLERLD